MALIVVGIRMIEDSDDSNTVSSLKENHALRCLSERSFLPENRVYNDHGSLNDIPVMNQ